MKNMLMKFYRDEQGQDMVEYALVVGIIALAATLTMQTVSDSIVTMWEKVNTAIGTATGLIP